MFKVKFIFCTLSILEIGPFELDPNSVVSEMLQTTFDFKSLEIVIGNHDRCLKITKVCTKSNAACLSDPNSSRPFAVCTIA